MSDDRQSLANARPYPSGSVEGSADRVRSRRRRTPSHWSRRSKGLFIGLILSLTALVVMGLYIATQVHVLQDNKAKLDAALDVRERELNRLRPEVERLRADVDALLHKQLPGLRPLLLDQVIAVDERYLRTIVFSLSKRAGQNRYEYRLTLRNDGLMTIVPRISLALFDRHGIHIGSARIGIAQESGEAIADLHPGESISKSGFITMLSDSEEDPVYFFVRVAEPTVRPDPLLSREPG